VFVRTYILCEWEQGYGSKGSVREVGMGTNREVREVGMGQSKDWSSERGRQNCI